MKQCLGVTLKGERCKNKVKDGPYCSRHSQNSQQPVQAKNQAGYVYIFTLAHLINGSPKKQKWLRQADPHPENRINFTETSVLDPKRNILIKVGYTTQPVKRRLAQWRDQCKQDFQLIGPTNMNKVVCSNRDRLSELVHRMKHLSVKTFAKFDQKQHAFKVSHAYRSEQLVHAKLGMLVFLFHLVNVVESFDQVRVAVGIGRVEPVDVQRAEVPLVQLNQSGLEFLGVAKLCSKLVGLVLVFSGKQIHGKLKNSVNRLKNVTKQQETNNNRLFLKESETLVQRLVVDESCKHGEDSKDVDLVDGQHLGCVRQSPMADLVSQNSNNLLDLGRCNQSIVNDNLLRTPWQTKEVSVGMRRSLGTVYNKDFVQRELVLLGQFFNLQLELAVFQRLDLVEQWLDEFWIDNNHKDLNKEQEHRQVIHELVAEIVDNLQESSKNWTSESCHDGQFLQRVGEPELVSEFVESVLLFNDKVEVPISWQIQKERDQGHLPTKVYTNDLSDGLVGLGSNLLGLGNDIFNTTNHVECVFRQVVVLSFQDSLERSNSVLQSDQSTLNTSENLSNGKWLRQESLDLSSSLNSQLVLFRQLIHTQNSNDILERLVSLQGLLDVGGNIVVLLANNGNIKQSRSGVQWVHSWVDTQLRDTSGQHSGSVQVGEGSSWSRISQIIGWHVNGLDGGNGTLSSGGNSLLQQTHISGQSWLVTDGRRNTTQQSRHFRTSLSESENVVNEQQHILTFFISEVLGNGQTSKSNSGSSSRWLVHLTEHQGDLRVTLQVDDTSLLHFTVQVVTFSGSLTHTSENGETTVSLGNVVNQLLNENGLTDTGTTEQSNLTTSCVWGKQVHNLDTSLQDFSSSRLLNKSWWVSVDWVSLLALNWTSLVNRLTNNVDDSTQSTSSDRDGNWRTSVKDGLTSNETLSTIHSNSSDGVLTQVLGDLQDQLLVVTLVDGQCIQNSWQFTLFELDVDNGTDNSSNPRTCSAVNQLGAIVSEGDTGSDDQLRNKQSTRLSLHRQTLPCVPRLQLIQRYKTYLILPEAGPAVAKDL
ncbi:hypothetical protein OGAPHI_000618 [Ogataea philodendri]|uniref:Bacteriophage T5 Orf172 DNA-binding domain-containing protein n=1 Tax=Ogataea philodendri TaxID=1378263 RepID=A0A9P8PF65_9ASCO|nr:uncharacterized protein OGAPHI_000618 [Ogataea philodendri]KAH3670907.1 hypothetical protein OGAPHI_000618 [Ogataea philodendri]